MKCFYGNATTQNTRACSDSTFDQQIVVIPGGQSCHEVRVYGSGADPIYTSQTAFDGSIVCQSAV